MGDGNKNVYNGTGNGGILTVGNVSGSLGALNIKETAVLSNSRAANGGAVYVTPYGTLTMTGGTINNNETTGSGAGIYLAEGSKLNISGNPNFGGTDVDDQGDLIPHENSAGNFKEGELESKTNGGKVYIRARQDIFIAGYANDDPEATNAASLVITGDIGSGEGSIWVWAQENPHYMATRQFGKIGDGVSVSEETLNAFRNARDDSTTENETGDYLRGTLEGETTGNVYWNGVSGNRKVILRKVDSTYTPVSDRYFTIYKGASSSAYTPRGETESLSGLPSGASGCFWIGNLPYGWYIVEESTPHRFFYFVVVESGTYGTLDSDNKDIVAGFSTREEAESEAKAKYDVLKDA